MTRRRNEEEETDKEHPPCRTRQGRVSIRGWRGEEVLDNTLVTSNADTSRSMYQSPREELDRVARSWVDRMHHRHLGSCCWRVCASDKSSHNRIHPNELERCRCWRGKMSRLQGRVASLCMAVGGTSNRQFSFSSFFSGLKRSLIDEEKIYSLEETSTFQVAKESCCIKDIKKSNECQLSWV